MTPKNKAKELVDKFRNEIVSFLSDSMKNKNVKECALIAVNEIINELDDNFDSLHCSDIKQYWEEVKQEIEKL
jgi:hypothetical protein